MLRTDPHVFVGPAETFPRDREYNANRFELVGSAQFSEKHRENLEEFGQFVERMPNPRSGPGYQSSALRRFVDSALGIKDPWPKGPNITEHDLEKLDFGAESYTPLSHTFTVNADVREYDRDLHMDRQKHPIKIVTVPGLPQDAAADIGINTNALSKMGTPIFYEQ